MNGKKPIHVKPSLYAHYFYDLKEIALKYGYNLVLHGSMKRDLDLIAIPWQAEVGNRDEMIDEFIEHLGGTLLYPNGVDASWKDKVEGSENWPRFSVTHHGRMWYLININRECGMKDGVLVDPQYYLDISVIPTKDEWQLG